MNNSLKKYFTRTGGLAIYLAILSLGLTSCNNGAVTSDSDSASLNGGSSAGVLSSCSEIKAGAHFNGGSGTPSDPYIICSEQQLLNISLAEIDLRFNFSISAKYISTSFSY